jgi:hypothetical protein
VVTYMADAALEGRGVWAAAVVVSEDPTWLKLVRTIGADLDERVAEEVGLRLSHGGDGDGRVTRVIEPYSTACCESAPVCSPMTPRSRLSITSRTGTASRKP